MPSTKAIVTAQKMKYFFSNCDTFTEETLMFG